jgi:hypothetical protein
MKWTKYEPGRVGGKEKDPKEFPGAYFPHIMRIHLITASRLMHLSTFQK